MKPAKTPRGFRALEHPPYLDPDKKKDHRVITESSAIDFDAEGGFENPGSSYLWVGTEWHLNRQEVAELIYYLQHWFDTGNLPEPLENEK